MNRHEFYDNLNKFHALSHSGNYKYYHKIDLPDGKARYFYTKAEWDAYQRELSTKKNTDQKLSADTLKKIEQQKQLKANYNKNAEAAKHEGDRWNNKKPINDKKVDSSKIEEINRKYADEYKQYEKECYQKADELKEEQKKIGKEYDIELEKIASEWHDADKLLGHNYQNKYDNASTGEEADAIKQEYKEKKEELRQKYSDKYDAVEKEGKAKIADIDKELENLSNDLEKEAKELDENRMKEIKGLYK